MPPRCLSMWTKPGEKRLLKATGGFGALQNGTEKMVRPMAGLTHRGLACPRGMPSMGHPPGGLCNQENSSGSQFKVMLGLHCSKRQRAGMNQAQAPGSLPSPMVTSKLRITPVSPDSSVPSGPAKGRHSHPSLLASNWPAIRSHTPADQGEWPQAIFRGTRRLAQTVKSGCCELTSVS